MPVDHLVTDSDVSVGQVGAEFVLQVSCDDHWLWYDLAGHRIDLARVDNLVINGQGGSPNQGEAVCVVGHLEPEVIVS